MLHLIGRAMLWVLESSKTKTKRFFPRIVHIMFVRHRSILFALFISVLIWFMVQHDQDHNTGQQHETISRHTQELMSCTHQLKSEPYEHFQRELHFLVSNEDDYRSWYSSLYQRGGIYLGVGAEQNYLLAAWTHAAHESLDGQ